MRTISVQIKRPLSTVSREVNRNGGRDSYRATVADEAAWQRALRPKACKIAGQLKLIRAIAQKLQRQWSPEQIAGWLKRQHPNDNSYHVPHETIYKTLFIQSRGVLKKELLACFKES